MTLHPVPTPGMLAGRPALPPAHRRGGRTWRVLAVAFGLLVIVVLALAMAAIVRSQTGVVGFLLGVGLALIPVPLVVGAFLWLDRHEPEPPALLVFAFAWGAVVATFVSSILNTASLEAVARAADQGSGLARTAVFVAPFVEEGMKGLGVLVILLARRREFDGVVDGIVCAGLVGVGFAFTENVLYYGRAYLQADATTPGSGVFAASMTFVLRGVLSPFAHPMFTIATGIGLGIASQTDSPARRVVAPLVGYAVAVSLHSTWNQSAVHGLAGFVRGYLAFMLPVFVAVMVTAAWLSTRESRLISRTLPSYVRAGWLPLYDVGMVASPAQRRRARRWAAGSQGPQARRAMARYQAAASEVALLRARAERGNHVPAFDERERSLLLELTTARSAFRPVLRLHGD